MKKCRAKDCETSVDDADVLCAPHLDQSRRTAKAYNLTGVLVASGVEYDPPLCMNDTETLLALARQSFPVSKN